MDFRPNSKTLLNVFPTFGKTSVGAFQTLEKPDGAPRKKGLTLIEVMLAIVILGVGAGTLMLATARCMGVALKAQHYSAAQRLLLRVNSEKPLSLEELEEGTETGSFDDGYTWEREVLESENEDRQGLYTVRTRVSWSMRGKTAYEETTTVLYIKPEDAEKGSQVKRGNR